MLEAQEASGTGTQLLTHRPKTEPRQPRLTEIRGGTPRDTLSELSQWRSEAVDYINGGNQVDLAAYVHDLGNMVGCLTDIVQDLLAALNETFRSLK